MTGQIVANVSTELFWLQHGKKCFQCLLFPFSTTLQLQLKSYLVEEKEEAREFDSHECVYNILVLREAESTEPVMSTPSGFPLDSKEE